MRRTCILMVAILLLVSIPLTSDVIHVRAFKNSTLTIAKDGTYSIDVEEKVSGRKVIGEVADPILIAAEDVSSLSSSPVDLFTVTITSNLLDYSNVKVTIGQFIPEDDADGNITPTISWSLAKFDTREVFWPTSWSDYLEYRYYDDSKVSKSSSSETDGLVFDFTRAVKVEYRESWWNEWDDANDAQLGDLNGLMRTDPQNTGTYDADTSVTFSLKGLSSPPVNGVFYNCSVRIEVEVKQ